MMEWRNKQPHSTVHLNSQHEKPSHAKKLQYELLLKLDKFAFIVLGPVPKRQNCGKTIILIPSNGKDKDDICVTLYAISMILHRKKAF
jgi:hypothetical protein